MEQRNKDHFPKWNIKQLGNEGLWDPTELPAPQMGRRQVSVTSPTSALSLLQARTWIFSSLFKTEYQAIGAPQKPMLLCVLWFEYCGPGSPGKVAVVSLTLQAGPPPFPSPLVHTLQSQPCWSLTLVGLAPLSPSGVSLLCLLLINEFLKYLTDLPLALSTG